MDSIERAFNKYWPLLLGGVLVYYVVKNFANKAIDTTGTGIANAWLAATLPAPVNVTATIILPDGSTISANSIYLNDQMQFTYNGKTYTLTGRDASNNYVAVAS